MQRNHSRTILVVLTILAVALALAAGGWAATGTVLYTFQNEADGWAPSGVIWLNGRVYGTTSVGGTYNKGTVFELVHTKSGWAKNTLHEFTGELDGGSPTAGLVADKSGRLYGTADAGAWWHLPVIFEMSRDGKGKWQFAVIHAITRSEGGSPNGLIIDGTGNLYGTTNNGGPEGCSVGCGTAFELSPVGGGGWKWTTLHDFDGNDGANPQSPLYRDAEGNLYGATEGGGGRGCSGSWGCGTVFEVSPSGGRWKFVVLHRFSGPYGAFPTGTLAMDDSGNLYGTVQLTFKRGYGAVYRLTPGKKGWKETAVHYFTGEPDGDGPTGGVIFDRNGDLYGATVEGGEFGYGAVFHVRRDGKAWKESVPFSFNGEDGNDPDSPLARGKGDALIGVTLRGGDGSCDTGCGVVYEFVP